MLLATWNVNSLNARMPRVTEWIDQVRPDVLCLQETKMSDAQFPALAFTELGYDSVHHGEGRWNGVAILSRVGLEDPVSGFPDGDEADPDARIVWATCGGVRIASVYVPNGRELDHDHYRYKLDWLARLRRMLDRHDPTDLLAVLGDWNVAPTDLDVWDPASFVGGTHVSDPERSAIAALEDWGLVDTLRRRYPDEGIYTFWDYRNGDFHKRRGMRIDYVLSTPALAACAQADLVDRNARKGTKPSDHAPVLALFDLEGSDVSDSEGPAPGRISPRIEGLNSLEATPRRAAERRLAAAMRDVIDGLVSSTASEAELSSAADDLEEFAALLRALPAGQTYRGFAESANAGQETGGLRPGDPEWYAFFDHSPIIGLANPLSPPVHLEYRADRVIGSVTFGAAYEGPPGCVHGGYVAAVFDELLGATQSLSGDQGMTAHLGVDYRRPTPLGVPLQLEGWFERREGRKIYTRARLSAGDELTAEADGLFIAFDREKFRALLEARDS